MLEHVQSHAHARRKRRLTGSPKVSVRDAIVALASAGVVALLVAYALAAPSARLTAEVGSPVPRPGSTALIQGRVLEADGGGLDGARIEVLRARQRAGVAVTDDAGAFRVELSGGCAVYDISVRARSAGSSVQAGARRQLCPGDALPIDARVITQGHFLWVPGPR
jgi:hypothetical protein